jgi:hypothetical protein
MYTPYITAAENELAFRWDVALNIIEPTITRLGSFVICAEPIPDGKTGMAFVTGLVPVKVKRTLGLLRRADVESDSRGWLVACPNGSAQIVWFATGENATGTEWALVRMGQPQYIVVRAKAVGNILVGSTSGVGHMMNGATETTYEINGIRHDWMTGGQRVSNNKEMLVGWFPDEQVWRIVGADCEN